MKYSEIKFRQNVALLFSFTMFFSSSCIAASSRYSYIYIYIYTHYYIYIYILIYPPRLSAAQRQSPLIIRRKPETILRPSRMVCQSEEHLNRFEHDMHMACHSGLRRFTEAKTQQ